ncbi:GntR family transcriptional regulator [Ornithinimicrobium sp. Arc0846-15]|nr:GntR family transcriptional regulator [Ornithinimicrobium laminariae]
MFEGREPIYQQIAEAIRGEILSGALNEGDQVMSTTQYASTYRINPATAAKAFAALESEGILRKQRGMGTFVSDGAPEQLRSSRRQSFFAERVDPLLRDADVLGIGADDLARYLLTSASDASSATNTDQNNA